MGNEWSMKPLEEVANVVMGYSPKGETYNNEGKGAPLLNGPTEFGAHSPRATLFTTDPSRFSEHGDILFCVRGSTTGRMNWSDRKYAVGRGIAAIRAKTNGEDTYFIYCCIREYMQRLLSLTSGSVFPNLSTGDINGFEIPWPEKPTRGSIVHILRTLDDKIELNRRMNRTLEKMAAAIFKSWFIDFDPVHAKAEDRDPGLPSDIAALFPDSFEKSELGAIPAGWTVAPVKDLADVNARSIKKDYTHARIRYIDISAVSRGSLDQTTTYDLADAPSRAKRLVKTGDTIWSCVRPNRKAYLYIDRPADNLVVSTGFAVLSPRVVPSSYLHQWVTTQAFVDYLTAYATGAAYPAVKADTFETAKMLLPTEGVPRAFHDLAGPLRARIAHNQRQNGRLAGLRDTLLPKLLSGEIEVPVAEAVAEGVN